MLDSTSFDALIRGAAAGGFAMLGLSMALAQRPVAVRFIGALFFLSAIGHTLDNCIDLQGSDGHSLPVIHILSVLAAGMFWLFALVLFEDDQRVSPWRAMPPVVLTTIAIAALNSPAWLTHYLWLANGVGTIILVLHALLVIWRGWRGDLVESRRRLRGPVMGVAAIYVLLTCLRDMGGVLSFHPTVPTQAQAIMLLVLALGGAAALLRVDSALVGTRSPTRPLREGYPAELDFADQVTLTKLSKAMTDEEIWRREDLSIRSLAEHLASTEHRVRRLINGELGHRNFAAFINAARIGAAKQALRDPDQAQRSISVIAFDLGFGSLGPFNRAFREMVGVTPKAWRQGQAGKILAETR